MDKAPLKEGHFLLIPKKHVEDFYYLPWKDYQELFAEAKRIGNALKNAYS